MKRSDLFYLAAIWALCPISPFIVMAALSGNPSSREKHLRQHLILSGILWTIVSIVFGFYGGILIDKLAALY